MSEDPIVIVGYARTPMGSLQGTLAPLTAAELGSAAIEGALQGAKLSNPQVAEVLMGCVLAAGQGQAPARQAALGAGLAHSTAATTVNKMCGSGMKAVMLATDALLANPLATYVAGGLESMSNAPYLLPKARAGYRLGHAELYDHMFLDGLEDAYERGCLMGVFAENTAEKYAFSRTEQDDFALQSLEKAQNAIAKGHFEDEIVAVTIKGRKGDTVVAIDEAPGNAKPDKIPQLKPAFKKEGTVTAANASSISDGAAALVLMRQSVAQQQGLTPIAKIVATATHAQEPAWFTTAPVGALKTLLAKTQWSVSDVDLFEINEAFAVVTMAAMQELNLDSSRVNVHGGACALGHPIGASGARILVTLLSALQQRDGKKGVAALCIGGGEATAVAVEMV